MVTNVLIQRFHGNESMAALTQYIVEASLAQTYPHRLAIREPSHCCSGMDLEDLMDRIPSLKIRHSNLGVGLRSHLVVLCMPGKIKNKHSIGFKIIFSLRRYKTYDMETEQNCTNALQNRNQKSENQNKSNQTPIDVLVPDLD